MAVKSQLEMAAAPAAWWHSRRAGRKAGALVPAGATSRCSNRVWRLRLPRRFEAETWERPDAIGGCIGALANTILEGFFQVKP